MTTDKDKLRLPKSLKIGYKTYTVRDMTETERIHSNSRGITYDDKGLLVVCTEKGDRQEQLNTLLHEILHACYHVGNLQDDDDEERTVHGLANVLLQVLTDNKIEGINM